MTLGVKDFLRTNSLIHCKIIMTIYMLHVWLLSSDLRLDFGSLEVRLNALLGSI